MIALQIENTKEFLSLLLEGSEFDTFRVGSCEVTTFVSFVTDGYRRHMSGENAESDDRQAGQGSERVLWKELKATIMQMIRSSSVPGTLSLDLYKYMGRDMGSVRIAFVEGRFTVTTGYMQKEFSLDHRGSEDWDDRCQEFFTKNGVIITVL